jgi:small subunit ribosomal protein S4
MGRITGPVCRLCRRDGLKLFLKGSRCDTPKCAFERRPAPPGVLQKRRPKPTDYGLRLREKQKVKHYYGVLERQFRTYFSRAARGKGNTGESLMTLLERRLDNVVHRLGFAASRAAARQMIMHGHITVNGHRLDIPSYLVKAGDLVHAALSDFRREVPDFLSRLDGAIPEARVDRLPGADDVSIPVQANLIIELCSK